MAFGNNRMMKIGRLILVLVTMANALPASAYEVTGGWGVATVNDPTRPYLKYFTPSYAEDGDEFIEWRMIVQHNRAGGHAAGTIVIEIRTKKAVPQTVLAATLVDGEQLTIDRVKSASEPCVPGGHCEIFQKVFLDITDQQILATNGKALRVRIASDRPFEIEFPDKIMTRLSQLLGKGI
jgi:hypothetical protein